MAKNIVLLTKQQAAARQKDAVLKSMHSEVSAMLRNGQGVAVHADKRTKRVRTRAAVKSKAITDSQSNY